MGSRVNNCVCLLEMEGVLEVVDFGAKTRMPRVKAGQVGHPNLLLVPQTQIFGIRQEGRDGGLGRLTP